MQRSDEKEEINVKIDIVWNEPSQEEVEEFMECASTAGCSGELSSKGSSTFWTAKDKGHSEDGGKWSFDSSISSTSLNYNKVENKMKDTGDEETYGIVKTAPGKYEVYIDPCLKENERWETSKYIKEDLDEVWTWTSSYIDAYYPDVPSTDLSKDAEERRIQFCELYVQDFFPDRPHRFHDKTTNERLERRGITLKRHYTKEETRQMKREVKENRRKGKDKKEGK